ncbi:MAG TPA: DUF402 domain-containing protein [Acidimicrobiia bacterium]|nr:DUF402 domain-containing protein [Acidimicrobiia bacterium]
MEAPGELVTVRFTKWGGHPHWRYDVELLGEDGYGRWAACRPGTVLRRADEPPKRQRWWFVMVVPHDGHWMAVWNESYKYEIYVDVTGEPRWSAGEVTAVDLDLDVVRWRDGGRVEVLDEDEFAEHRMRFGYPPDVVAGARSTADWLVEAVGARREPFGEVGPRWLRQALSLPIRSRPVQ